MDSQPSTPSTTDNANYHPAKGIPIQDIIECITIKGLTVTETAKTLGITPQTVSIRCKRHGIIPKQALTKYKDNRADILAAKGAQILKSLSEDDIKKIPPGSRATAFGILYDKERLERGQSTSNVSYNQICTNIEELEAEEAEILAELAEIEGGE